MLRSIKYGLHGAVIAGLIAVPTVWSAVDKTIHLDVDGQTRTVSTSASTVAQVLQDKGYVLDSHDVVAPGLNSTVQDGSQVVLRHGRLLHLSVDGLTRDVWTTEPTVAAALAGLGFSGNDYVSVSRSQRLPLQPTDLQIRTPQLVTVVHDGDRESVMTTDATVGQLLADLGLSVGPLDRLSAAPQAALASGAVIQLQRVIQKTGTQTVPVPFQTTQNQDASLPAGTTQVVTAGKNGTAQVTYALVYVDGQLVGRTEVGSTTVQAPQSQVVNVGTMQVPNPSPGTAQAIAQGLLAQRGWGNDQFACLVQMWDHESGWRTNAANGSGAYGIPQALPGSKMSSAGADWQSNATTQITWGLGYIASRYGTPCGAWSFWQAHSYY